MQVNKVTEENIPLSTLLKRNSNLGDISIPSMQTFQNTGQHTDMSPDDLSKQWYISVDQVMKALHKATQKFLHSAILLLARRYHID
eukprot:3573687-Ditylum_brightwellii.AAC.1